MDTKRFIIVGFMALVFLGVWYGLSGIVGASNSPILHRFSTISTIALTIPASGDVNPLVARVNHSSGSLKEGHLLVSNFSKRADTQDSGAAILDVAPDGTVSVFSRIAADRLPGSCPGGAGVITGIAVLRGGWVIAGALPLTGGPVTSQTGCLIVFDSLGNPVETFSGSLINGPRDIVVSESDHEAKLFVANVFTGSAADDGRIAGQASVVRINLNIPGNSMPLIESMTVIGSGFSVRNGPDAVITGPVGIGLSPRCENSEDDTCADYGQRQEQVLYVADSLNNRIAVIHGALHRTASAGTGQTLSAGGSLNDPLGLVVAPNGHILIANGNGGFITEITPQGKQIAIAPAAQYRQTAWNERTVVEPTLASVNVRLSESRIENKMTN